jgi:hypothetical protein
MSELSFRLSREGDVPMLQRLWAEVFGDGEEFTGEFFRLLWRPENCRVAESGGEIAAMGFCIPGAVARGARCSYIYAMATAERYRGLGAAREIGLGLIADAFASGADLVATLPAEDSLCRWYETRLGMAPLFKKGGAGVEFPESWLKFAAVCGAHEEGTPSRLWAVPRPGFDPSGLEELGWECTFD